MRGTYPQNEIDRSPRADRDADADLRGDRDRQPASNPGADLDPRPTVDRRAGRDRGLHRRFDFDIAPTELRHGPGCFDVIHLANGHPLDPARRAHHARLVGRQLERFPEGQFVAVTVRDGEEVVVGTATTMRTGRSPDAPPLSWHEVIGDYGLPRHDPEGEWLYGVEIAVHPEYQRRGIASALYRARLALVPELGLRGWYAGGMLMGYHRYADVLTPRAYAERVIAGELHDPTVSMQLHRGLVPAGIIEGYCAEPKAGDCAVLLVWRPASAGPTKGVVQSGVGTRSRTPGRTSARPARAAATSAAVPPAAAPAATLPLAGRPAPAPSQVTGNARTDAAPAPRACRSRR